MTRTDGPESTPSGRRAFLAGLGAAGAAGLAGCGGGGDGSGDGGGDGGGSGDGRFQLFVGRPSPDLAQYNVFNPRSYPAVAELCRHSIVGLSAIDNRPYGDLAASWSYDAGTLDVELHDDFYWWDGANVTSEDVTMSVALQERALTGSPKEHVESVEATGSHSVRYHLTETLREQPAVIRTLADVRPLPRSYYGEWHQRFEDASSESEREDVAINLSDLREDKVIRPFFNVPFEMTTIGDIAWVLTRRTDDDPTPHYVDEINFDTVEVNSTEENARERGLFNAGDAPFTDLPTMMDADISYDTAVVELPQAASPGAYIFNCQSGPTASVHFRRAFAYLLDRSYHSPQAVKTDEIPTGFTSAPAEEQYFGDLLDSFETYGPDEVRTEAARAAMEAGGFERNSAGKWLYRSGSKAGQPISITVPIYATMNPFKNLGENFAGRLREFGIDLSFDTKGDPSEVLDSLETGEFTVSMSFWGGPSPLPASVYRATFVQKTPTYGNPSFPTTWEGPPLGESGGEASTTYEVDEAARRLDVVADDQQYQRSLEELGWVFNQALPKLPIGSYRQRYRLNTVDWDWQLPTADHPGAWQRAGLQERSWNIGAVQRASGSE